MTTGITSFVGAGKETTWGTPVAAARYAPLMSESINLDIEQVGVDVLAGLAQRVSPAAGADTIAGDLRFQVRPTHFGDVLRSLLDAPTSVVLTAGQSYKHTFKPRTAPFGNGVWGAPYTLEIFKGIGTSSHQFAGVLINTIELSMGSRSRVLEASAGVIGKKRPVLIAKTTPTLEPRQPFTWNMANIKLPDPTVYKEFMDLTFTLGWGYRTEHLLDETKEIGLIMPDSFMTCRVSGTAYPFTTAEWTEFLNQTERKLIITVDSGVNIGSSADKYKITITLPKFRYDAYRYGAAGPGLIAADIEGEAYYNVADTTAVQIEVQNELSAY
jgi:hypothetical protein